MKDWEKLFYNVAAWYNKTRGKITTKDLYERITIDSELDVLSKSNETARRFMDVLFNWSHYSDGDDRLDGVRWILNKIDQLLSMEAVTRRKTGGIPRGVIKDCVFRNEYGAMLDHAELYQCDVMVYAKVLSHKYACSVNVFCNGEYVGQVE